MIYRVAIYVSFVLCCVIMPVSNAYAGDGQGRVTILQGEADKRSIDGDWDGLAQQDRVIEGERVKTFEDSLAEITLHGTQKIRLGPLTTVDFESVFSEGERTVSDLELEEGDIWAEVEHLNEASSFNVSSRVARATVRGTVFTVHTDKNGTELNVYRGAVEVKGKKVSLPVVVTEHLPEGEIPAPREVPGPREISLSEWVQVIGKMQQILIAPDGSMQVRDIKEKDAFTQKWQQWNARLVESQP